MVFNDSRRKDLVAIYHAALAAVHGKHCVAQYLLDNPLEDEIYLLAIGKAAGAMVEGALEVLGSRIKDNLVITTGTDSSSDLRLRPNLRVLESAHPVPDERSIAAGRQTLAFIQRLPASAKLLCLISGGTSALIEVLPDNVSLEQLRALNEWLLKSGLPISEMNAIRKRVSCIKGGRLAAMLKQQQVKVLLISDVKGDRPADIGSGLFFPPTSGDLFIAPGDYPREISLLMDASPAFPDKTASCFNQISYSLIATLEHAINAARQVALTIGYEVTTHSEYLQGDAVEAGVLIAKQLRQEPNKLHIWGGECTVKLPDNPGSGGRCQSLALSAAITLANQNSWCLLAAGSDGSDGSVLTAGACVDENTLRNKHDDSDNIELARDYLNRADAGSYLKKTDNLLPGEETGTNVADLVLGYCE